MLESIIRGLYHLARTEVVCESLKDRKSTRLNSSHTVISYAVFCLEKKDTKEWWTAMKDEKQSIDKNKTWDLTSLPPGRKANSSTWTVNKKERRDAPIMSYTDRLRG